MKKHFIIGILSFILLVSLTGCIFNSEEKKPTDIEKEPKITQIESEITETYQKISSGCVGIYAENSTSGSVGSGVIYRNDNGLYYVVTNQHVINDMTKVRIYRGGTKYYSAEVVGYDAKNDIAVLTFSLDLLGGSEIYVNDIFNYTDEIVTVGQTVLAIGCPLGLENFNSLSTGVVSRVGRSFLQTNAEINPGNSGGGLFNASGRLIGINTEKEIYTEGSDGTAIPVEGIGFAISLNVVKKCITDIEKHKGEIKRPLLGITVQAVNRYLTSKDGNEKYLPNSVDAALVVVEIEAGVAHAAGVHIHDVIVAADDNEINKLEDLSAILSLKLIGDTIVLKIYRPETNKELNLTITL